MRRHLITSLAAVAGLSVALVGAGAKAASISVQFVGTGTPIPSGSTPTGVYPVLASNFNLEGTAQTGSGAAVTADDGSTGTLSWTSANLYGSGGAGSTNADLLSGYLDNNGTTPSTASLTLPVSIAGTGSTPYNVIVYIAGDSPGRFGTSTINSGTPVTLIEGSQNGGTFVQAVPGAADGSTGSGGNYYEFTGITGTTLSISNLGTNSGTPRLPFDGFQVFSAPEPASLGLLVIGAFGLLTRRRQA